MAWLRMFGGVTVFDVFIGAAGSMLIGWGSLLALGQPRAGDQGGVPRVLGLSVPVRVLPISEASVDTLRLKRGVRHPRVGAAVVPSDAERSLATPRTPIARPRPPLGRSAERGHEDQSRLAHPARTPPAIGFEPATPGVEPSAEEADTASFGDGVSGDSTEGYGSEEGFPEGSPDGTIVDPLVARAVALYRARLSAWLAAHFRVSGSGLSRDELRRLRVTAVVRIDEHRSVAGYSYESSGNRAFDAAAERALRAVEGAEIPPPPSLYPGPVQRRIQVTFVCREDRCD